MVVFSLLVNYAIGSKLISTRPLRLQAFVVWLCLAWRGWLTAAFSIVSIVIIFYPAESI